MAVVMRRAAHRALLERIEALEARNQALEALRSSRIQGRVPAHVIQDWQRAHPVRTPKTPSLSPQTSR